MLTIKLRRVGKETTRLPPRCDGKGRDPWGDNLENRWLDEPAHQGEISGSRRIKHWLSKGAQTTAPFTTCWSRKKSSKATNDARSPSAKCAKARLTPRNQNQQNLKSKKLQKQKRLHRPPKGDRFRFDSALAGLILETLNLKYILWPRKRTRNS